MKNDRYIHTVSALFLLSACVGQPPRTPHSSTLAAQFPSQNQLDELPSRAVPVDAFAQGTARVETWTVVSTSEEDTTVSQPLVAALRETAGATKGAAISKEMSCFARDSARFFAAKKAVPARSIAAFLAGRCGLSHDGIASRYLALDAPVDLSDAEVVKQLLPKVREMATALKAPVDADIGVGLVREGTKVAVSVAGAKRSVVLDADTLRVSAGRATIKGKLNDGAGVIVAFVNQGRFGVQPCVTQPTVKAPAFELVCPVSADDAYAWVSITNHQHGEVMLRGVAEVMVSSRDRSTLTFAEEPLPNKPTAATDLTLAIVEELNRVRALAGLPLLEFSQSQSKTNGRLLGTFFDARAQGQRPQVERIALGLLAGWDVGRGAATHTTTSTAATAPNEGAPNAGNASGTSTSSVTLRDGSIFSSVIAPASDAAVFVRDVLVTPLGRVSLLRAGGGFVAVGAEAVAKANGIAAIVTTYQTFDSDDHTEDEALLRRRIDRERAARGLPRITWRKPSQLMRAELAKVSSGEHSASEAISNIANSGFAAYETGRAYYGEALGSVDSIEMPPDFDTNRPLTVEFGITHSRPSNSPWGQLEMLLVVTPGEPEKSANVDARRGAVF